MATFLQIEEPPKPAVTGWALWQLGFRPFYLLAAAFTSLSVGLWGLQVTGLVRFAYLDTAAAHAHEMLFGFALAVIVGFLFTAGRNWSGQPTPTGRPLMALAALWLLARVLALTPWGLATAAANLAFAWGSAWGLWKALRAGQNQRNYFFVALLVGMGLASLGVQLALQGRLPLPAWAGLQIGLDLVLFIMAVMGGRVIPMFTNNGVPGTNARRQPQVEQAALGGVLLLAALDLLPPGLLPAPLMAGVLLLVAVAHGARLALWQPWRTRRAPLVWVLHAAYAWISLHLALRAAAGVGVVPASVATPALTAGAIGGLIIGMMTRTARGHTGRPLRADGWEVTMYAAVLGAALLRVGVPLLWPSAYLPAIAGAALLWAAGFGLYAWRYAPILTRPRLDGRPG